LKLGFTAKLFCKGNIPTNRNIEIIDKNDNAIKTTSNFVFSNISFNTTLNPKAMDRSYAEKIMAQIFGCFSTNSTNNKQYYTFSKGRLLVDS
jgi:hypothetical protein